MKETLRDLGVADGPVEIILTTYFPNSKIPNAAPMGLEYQNQKLIFRIHKETDTYRNLISNKAGVVNITNNLALFVDTALKKKSLQKNEFEPADLVNAPRIKAANAFIEFIPINFFDYIKKDKLGVSKISKIEAIIEKIHVKNFIPALKRKVSPSLEAIILATKLQVALKRNKEALVKEFRKKIEKSLSAAKSLPKERKVAEYIEKTIREYL